MVSPCQAFGIKLWQHNFFQVIILIFMYPEMKFHMTVYTRMFFLLSTICLLCLSPTVHCLCLIHVCLDSLHQDVFLFVSPLFAVLVTNSSLFVFDAYVS